MFLVDACMWLTLHFVNAFYLIYLLSFNFFNLIFITQGIHDLSIASVMHYCLHLKAKIANRRYFEE